jgi:hypothetical protein
MRNWYLILLWLMITLSCTKKKAIDEGNSAFKKPEIIYSFQSDKQKDFLQPKSIAPSDPVFAGKYKFNDTIKLDLKKEIIIHRKIYWLSTP